MTPDQVKLVQQSFAKLAPIADQAAVMFYDRLFEVAPHVKAMFPRRFNRAAPEVDGDAFRRGERTQQS